LFRDISLTDELRERLEEYLRSAKKYIFDVLVGNFFKRFCPCFIKLLLAEIRKCRANSHTSNLDITLKPVDFRRVIYVAKSSLLVDEALGFTIVVTTRDTLTTVGKHLD
jgi:hypothetical protein